MQSPALLERSRHLPFRSTNDFERFMKVIGDKVDGPSSTIRLITHRTH